MLVESQIGDGGDTFVCALEEIQGENSETLMRLFAYWKSDKNTKIVKLTFRFGKDDNVRLENHLGKYFLTQFIPIASRIATNSGSDSRKGTSLYLVDLMKGIAEFEKAYLPTNA